MRSARDEDGRPMSDNSEAYLTAALGTKWAHCVNIRLVLEILSGTLVMVHVVPLLNAVIGSDNGSPRSCTIPSMIDPYINIEVYILKEKKTQKGGLIKDATISFATQCTRLTRATHIPIMHMVNINMRTHGQHMTIYANMRIHTKSSFVFYTSTF